jgi:hypothetical protein
MGDNGPTFTIWEDYNPVHTNIKGILENSHYWRPIIAAVADVAWRKVLDSLKAMLAADRENKSRSLWEQIGRAEANIAAWRKWGEA